MNIKKLLMKVGQTVRGEFCKTVKILNLKFRANYEC